MKPVILNISLRRPEAASYRVFVGSGLLKQMPAILKKMKFANRYVIITDDVVKKIYGNDLKTMLEKAGLKTDIISFHPGERSKNEETKKRLDHAMLAKKCGRDSLILALGGGVVGDMAGYVAATYMRGIPYVQVPTSFLAMVDSSLGGKVGVDTPYGKNLIGAFWHPEAVIADTGCLAGLPKEQLVNGLMEAVKIFLTYDAKYFQLVLKNWKKILHKDRNLLQKIIAHAMELKIGVIVRDEHDLNERMVVNWGHTVGHAMEHLSNYTLLHGYGVALGILVESKIAQLVGVLSEKDFNTVRNAMKLFGIDEKEITGYNPEKVVQSTVLDKKNRDDKVKYVLLEKIGKVRKTHGKFSRDIAAKIVMEALKFFKTQ